MDMQWVYPLMGFAAVGGLIAWFALANFRARGASSPERATRERRRGGRDRGQARR